MKAIIPLAGRGTRLRPLTHHTPKPLLRVGGRPILSYLLDDVKALGIDEMVFIVGYRSEVIRDFIASEYPDLRPHYTTQEVMDGTAGAIKLAERARELIDTDSRLACHLAEMAAQAEPSNSDIHIIRAEVYQYRRDREISLMAKGIFGSAAGESKQKLED